MSSGSGAERWVLTGRVQGVGFRWFARHEAERLGLSGWVRNRSDGAVELVVSGPGDARRALEERLRQGPPSARVERLDKEEAESPPPEGFTIRR